MKAIDKQIMLYETMSGDILSYNMSQTEINAALVPDYLKNNASCPGGGVYSRSDGDIECTVHGTLP